MAMIGYLLCLAVFSVTHALDPGQEYPYPRIVIMGQSGVGKSSLGNVLAGCQPSNEEEECFFPVCSGTDSCTSETSIARASFLGKWGNETYGEVTLVDTPGFGDSSGDDSPLLANMIEVLKNTLGDANLIILCQTGNGRFNPSTITMLQELESMFGRERLWDNVMIEVTKWAYDSKSIGDRERQGITEESTLKDINDHIMEIAHLPFPLDGIFLDSYAVYYPDDELQQSYFYNYSRMLWEKANSLPKFDFFTIEDLVDQLDDCRTENDCLNDVLNASITHIEDQLNLISGRVTINEVTIDQLVMPPTGTVTAWLGGKTMAVPNGWQKCDGSPILEGPLKGTNTPDLNGEELFLRGGDVTSSWTVQPDQIMDHKHEVSDPGHTHSDGGHGHTDKGHTHAPIAHKHEDAGHNHNYLSTNWAYAYDESKPYRNPDDWHTKKQGKMWSSDEKANILNADAKVHTAEADIQTGYSSISTDNSTISVMGISSGSAGTETRPKNMVVEWIIKIQ